MVGITCAGVFLGSSLIGCATSGKQDGFFGNYGNLNASKNITENFENYKAKPDHTYFIAGSDKKSPDAILGVDNNYKLAENRFWHPLNSQDKTIKDLVENMQDKASESNNRPYGADILSHTKTDIGDWYSTTNTTIIKTKDGKTFQIYAPTTGIMGGGSESSEGSSGGGDTGGGGI